MDVKIELNGQIRQAEVVTLYCANKWSSAENPEKLMLALSNSHTLVTARIGDELVGLANAISDGSLVVYYPHLLVHPAHQRKGIGRKMMEVMKTVYGDFHQQMLIADGDAIKFYETLGFQRAGKTVAMWVYAGSEH